jgi:hypothetical protein
MENVRSITVPLDQIVIFKPTDFDNWWVPKFGPTLAKILYEYTSNPSLDILDQNKDVIKDGFLEYDKSRFNQRGHFFYRLEKIIRLLEWWLEHKKWRDPIVLIFLTTYDGKNYYSCNPGNDRVLLMKAIGETEYSFLEFDQTFIKNENFKEIQSYWGDYSSNLSLTHSKKMDYLCIQNKDNFDTILKYEKSVEWLKSDKTLLEFLHK